MDAAGLYSTTTGLGIDDLRTFDLAIGVQATQHNAIHLRRMRPKICFKACLQPNARSADRLSGTKNTAI